MNQIFNIRRLVLFALTVTLMAAFPAAASAADLFLEEGTETIPAKTVPTGESTVNADEYPASVTGQRLKLPGIEEGKLEILELGLGYSVRCHVAEVDGGTLSAAASELDLAVDYSDCWIGIGKSDEEEVAVSTNGCTYELSDIGALNGGANTDAAAAIACDEGDAIEFEWANSCKVRIPSQTLSPDAELANAAPEGSKLIAAGILGSGATYVVENESEIICHELTGGLFPVSGTYEDGVMESDLGFADLFLEEGTETIPAKTVPTGESTVNADEYPASVTGQRLKLPGIEEGKLEILELGLGYSVRCHVAEVDGGTLSAAASELDLAVDYSDCWIGIGKSDEEEVAVSTNGCTYELSDIGALNGGANTDAAAAIACDEGDAIEFEWANYCKVRIPSQTLSPDAELANAAPEGSKLIAAGILGSGATYVVENESEIICHELTGGLFPVSGTYEDGVMESDLGLQNS